MDLIVFILATLPKFSTIKVEPNLSAVATLSFIRSTSSLLYYVNRFTGLKRLYIPQPLIKEVLNIVYGASYLGFNKYFEIISKS